jgi:acetyl esterase/lipase
MVTLLAGSAVAATNEFPIWPGIAPGAEQIVTQGKQLDPTLITPTLTVHLPPADKANGTAVLVIPGGGYAGCCWTYEGNEIAQWFAARGAAGFTLKYRRPVAGKERLYDHTVPLADAQRALRIIRARAAEWRLKPDRIGTIGFSAGGHLASSLGVHFDAGDAQARDPIERVGSRPDFMILIYPVLDMSTAGVVHGGSRSNLLGPNPDPKLYEFYSSPKQVTAQTPPTFLLSTTGDTAVPAQNCTLMYDALKRAGVACELHVFEKGRHGYGMKNTQQPVTDFWPALLEAWLKQHAWLH